MCNSWLTRYWSLIKKETTLETSLGYPRLVHESPCPSFFSHPNYTHYRTLISSGYRLIVRTIRRNPAFWVTFGQDRQTSCWYFSETFVNRKILKTIKIITLVVSIYEKEEIWEVTCFRNLVKPNNKNIRGRVVNPQGKEVRMGGPYLTRLEFSVIRGVIPYLI